jgi:DNA-binding beta-propeller fold protein YncE
MKKIKNISTTLFCLLLAVLNITSSHTTNLTPLDATFIEISPFGNTHKDEELISPKSVCIHPTEKKMYINALEAGKTLVYSTDKFEKIKTINHSFNSHQDPKPGTLYFGKPVECQLTHHGKYLWTTYYRWSDDPNAMGSSGFSIIDTKSNEILKVIPTGNIPKFITSNDNDTLLAVTLWGENKIELYDIHDPLNAKLIASIPLGPKVIAEPGSNRDQTCGLCLRGTAFIPNTDLVAVAQMGNGGGIWLVNYQTHKPVRLLKNIPATPRHLEFYQDWLYLSSNLSGTISKISLEDLVRASSDSAFEPKVESKQMGEGARTIKIFNGKIYVALNQSLKIAISSLDFKNINYLDAPAYPVGLDVNDQIIVITSQGRNNHGGHRVRIYPNQNN